MYVHVISGVRVFYLFLVCLCKTVITTSLLLLLLVIDVIVFIYYYYTLVSNVIYCILLYISLGVMRLVS